MPSASVLSSSIFSLFCPSTNSSELFIQIVLPARSKSLRCTLPTDSDSNSTFRKLSKGTGEAFRSEIAFAPSLKEAPSSPDNLRFGQSRTVEAVAVQLFTSVTVTEYNPPQMLLMNCVVSPLLQ